jgi:hypothetical protein
MVPDEGFEAAHAIEPEHRRGVWIALVAVWIAAVAAGLGAVWRYEARPGTSGGTPETWPAVAGVALDGTRATLVLLAHPHCPCTRATMTELEAIMQRANGHLSAYVLFLEPADAGEEWRRSELWERAARIPSVVRMWDVEGRIAAAFGAKTSGETALYSTDGRLLFRGGITSARGHVGDNAGESAIVALALGRPAPVDDGPVYGCPLEDPAQR